MVSPGRTATALRRLTASRDRRRIQTNLALALSSRIPLVFNNAFIPSHPHHHQQQQPHSATFSTSSTTNSNGTMAAHASVSTETPVIRRRETPEELLQGIVSGDRYSLARAITLVESSNPAHRVQAQELLAMVLQAETLAASGATPISSSSSSPSSSTTTKSKSGSSDQQQQPKAPPTTSSFVASLFTTDDESSSQPSPSSPYQQVDEEEEDLDTSKYGHHHVRVPKEGESNLPLLSPRVGRSFRIGLSGPPGVGKSTFIESFGMYLVSQGHKVSVLAVDPSSARTGGSILGDKTRMTELSRHQDAYVRPSPSRGTLGGVARNTTEAITLCEAAGYDICLVETVGVGQSETMVADMVDMFVLLVPPAGGDELQGMKKGIMELSDLVIVNKSDGALVDSARYAQIEYTSALKFVKSSTDLWKAKVIRVSSLMYSGVNTTGSSTKTKDTEVGGMEHAWTTMREFYSVMKRSGQLQKTRGKQRKLWMWRQVSSELMDMLQEDQKVKKLAKELERKVIKNEIMAGVAANEIVESFLQRTTLGQSGSGGSQGKKVLMENFYASPVTGVKKSEPQVVKED